MKKWKAFIHLVMLFTTPTLLAYPQNHVSPAMACTVNYGYQQQAEEWVRPTTYDEIMQMLEDLESGELERRYLPTQLERVNDYLALLAKEGILPDEYNEEIILEEDVEDLIYGEDSGFQLARYLENSSEYTILPTVLDGHSGYNIVQCGKISKSWKKSKKFVKKHKKEIIIGAVVVVAVTVVAVAVVAASSATAATAAVGAAIGAGSGSSDANHAESKKSEVKKESPAVSTISEEASPAIDANEAPAMKAAINEHISFFKEFLAEDKAAQRATSSRGWDEMSLGEKAREAGASIAHQAFDEVSDLVKVVPQLCEEVKELRSKFITESFPLPNSEDAGSPLENYENLLVKGHQKFDKIFSTDQTELFTLESRAIDPMSGFAIGMLPLPGEISKIFSNTAKLIENGKVLDRAGFSRAGRGLMKHGYRKGSVFPKPLGNPKQVNEHGQKMLESIVSHPERSITYKRTKHLGEIIDIQAPEIGGVRYNAYGDLIGFLEP